MEGDDQNKVEPQPVDVNNLIDVQQQNENATAENVADEANIQSAEIPEDVLNGSQVQEMYSDEVEGNEYLPNVD